MTESPNRVGVPSRSTDSHGRTDGRTNEEASHLGMNPSPNASPAGGLKEFDDSLFPDLEPIVIPEPEHLSADRRRTQRQREDVTAGRHPLTRGRLSGDPDATCGNCRFRELFDHHRRTYPKCVWTPASWSADDYAHTRPPRHSNGAASDVRAWWPGCADHEWGDPKLSADAARCRPEAAAVPRPKEAS